MDLKAFGSAITQIVEEKGIPAERVVETIELALAAAYKRDYASRGEHIRVKLDPKTGKMQVFKVFLVVDESMLKPEEEVVEDGTIVEPEQPTAAKKQLIKGGPPSSRAEAPKGNPPSSRSGGTLADAQIRNSASAEADLAEDTRIRFNPERHMMVADAKKIQKGIKAGEELVIELETHEEFGRIAAQTAKQVIVQRLREVERETIAQEYADKAGEIVSGVVQRVEGRTIYIDLGRGIGVLFPHEQIPGEYMRLGTRVRALLLEVNTTPRGPQILLSRAHPNFVKQSFALEVPEIASGTVEIKNIAREPGSRTKIAVVSNQQGVDPIGACVGQRGTRVLTVINELNGEKIDVIEWSEDAERFIANALAPAKVASVELRERSTALVKVPEDQLSLAIGREGQNVRLAVKLTNWKIDIEGAEEFLAEEEEMAKESKEDGEEGSPPVSLGVNEEKGETATDKTISVSGEKNSKGRKKTTAAKKKTSGTRKRKATPKKEAGEGTDETVPVAFTEEEVSESDVAKASVKEAAEKGTDIREAV